jgi:hypothetical protein
MNFQRGSADKGQIVVDGVREDGPLRPMPATLSVGVHVTIRALVLAAAEMPIHQHAAGDVHQPDGCMSEEFSFAVHTAAGAAR